jgi:phosphoenolpyruvate carboxylase
LLDRSLCLDPLNHVQVELLKEHRADEQVLRGITINGISQGCGTAGGGAHPPGERHLA